MHDEEFLRRQKRETLDRDPAWRAVFVIFDKFGRDCRIWDCVDLDKETIRFKHMIKDYTFSGQERRLVEIAASLF